MWTKYFFHPLWSEANFPTFAKAVLGRWEAVLTGFLLASRSPLLSDTESSILVSVFIRSRCCLKQIGKIRGQLRLSTKDNIHAWNVHQLEITISHAHTHQKNKTTHRHAHTHVYTHTCTHTHTHVTHIHTHICTHIPALPSEFNLLWRHS